MTAPADEDAAVATSTGGVQTIRTLYVGESPETDSASAHPLEREDDRLSVVSVGSVAGALDRLGGDVDCVVARYDLPDGTGIDLLEAVRAEADVPFVLFTDAGSEAVASEAVAAGVTEYVPADRETDPYAVLADRVVTAVEDRQTRSDRPGVTDRQESLARLGRRALETAVPDALFEAALGAVTDHVGADRATLFRRTDAGRLVPVAVEGADLDAVANAPADSPASRALADGEPVVVDDRTEADPALDGEGSALAVPVGPASAPWGTLAADASTPGQFSPTDVAFVRNVANVLGGAIERDRATRRHRGSEAHLREVAELSPDAIFRLDTDGVFRYVSPAAEPLLGATPAELLGTSFERFVAPDYREFAMEAFQRAVGGEAVREVDIALVADDGERRDVEVTAGPVRNEAGEVVAVQGFARDITDRKERERELERSRRHYRTLVEHFPDGGVFLFDSDLRITLAGGAELERVGLSPEKMEGKRPSELFPEGVGTELEACYQAALDGEARTIEQTYQGSTYLVQTVPLETGENPMGMSVSRNVTEHRERERKLDRLRRRTQALMHTETKAETAQVATDAADEVIGAPLSSVFLLDDDGETLAPSAALEAVYDVFDEEPRYSHPAEPGTRAALVWGVYESGEPRVIDDAGNYEGLTESTPAGSALLHPIGDHGVFVVSSTEPDAYDESDRALVEILASTLTAAMDRVEREQRLRERERRLERLHEATRRLIRAETREEIADRAVEAASDVLGFSITVVRYHDPEAGGLVPVGVSDGVREALPERTVFTPDGGSLNWSAFEAEEVRVHDDVEAAGAVDAETALGSLMILPLGSYGTISVGETVPDAFDETDVFLARILATATETALEADDRESELRRQRNELERQNERLGEFANIVSHDLRNPLSVAQGRLALAREEQDSEHLEAVWRAHDRMETLIDDLLTLSRDGADAGEAEWIDLAVIADACRENVETGRARIVVETDLTVRAHEGRLRQLLENLFRNAVEHGGEDVTVTVGTLDGTTGEDGGAAGFYVADDGPGIPPDRRERVFEAGYSTSAGGTGYGLRIVAEIADAHGWGLRLTEADDGGARFEFRGVETR